MSLHAADLLICIPERAEGVVAESWKARQASGILIRRLAVPQRLVPYSTDWPLAGPVCQETDSPRCLPRPISEGLLEVWSPTVRPFVFGVSPPRGAPRRLLIRLVEPELRIRISGSLDAGNLAEPRVRFGEFRLRGVALRRAAARGVDPREARLAAGENWARTSLGPGNSVRGVHAAG